MASKLKAIFSRSKGQAIAEFSLALPILMIVVVGLLEAGRAVFMYSSVVNASREAVRYATAYGVNESDVPHIQNCAEIENTARRVGFLLPLDQPDSITIAYGSGSTVLSDPDGIPASGDETYGPPPDPPDDLGACDGAADGVDDGVDTTVTLECGDRVIVTVRAQYDPILPLLIPLQGHMFESSSARTYLGIVKLSDDADPCK